MPPPDSPAKLMTRMIAFDSFATLHHETASLGTLGALESLAARQLKAGFLSNDPRDAIVKVRQGNAGVSLLECHLLDNGQGPAQ